MALLEYRIKISKIANDINSTLPRMVDSETKAMTVTAAPNELQYKYVFVNYSSRDIGAQSLQQIWAKDIRTGICSTPDTRDLLKMGIQVTCVYYGSDNKYITEITIREADCR
jgi:hypothetical protein